MQKIFLIFLLLAAAIQAYEPFTGEWLKEYPEVFEHLKSEHLLHVRGRDDAGKGLHWDENKFKWKLNPKYNPEADYQMKMGYFIIPKENAEIFFAGELSPAILKEIEIKNRFGELIGYRFFVHPETLSHFSALNEALIPYIKPEDSEFIGTPTSSYRSIAIRRLHDPKATPFIVKIGAGAYSANNAKDRCRLLPRRDVQNSIEGQKIFNSLAPKDDLVIFSETFGLSLKNISGYPAKTGEDSGMIIREFPARLLKGECKIFSLSAVMSVEGMKNNQLPLIYPMMEAAIKKGIVKTPREYFETYLIRRFLKAIEEPLLEKGLAIAPHGQNLCVVLNRDLTPQGFAYRDHEGLLAEQDHGTIEAYTWFYRYHILVKLLNVVTHAESNELPPPPGAPTQKDVDGLPFERSLHYYLRAKCFKNTAQQKMLISLSLSYPEYLTLLKIADLEFSKSLSRYFNLNKANIKCSDGCFPAAESKSSGEPRVKQADKELWRCFIGPHRLQAKADPFLGACLNRAFGSAF